MSKVKKGDTVVITTGKDRGKKGKIISVVTSNDEKENKVLVEGVNMATKHKKPRGMQQPGGIIRQESPIYISNVKLVCPKCNEPARIGKRITQDNQKVRFCKKCNEEIDIITEYNKK